MSWFSNTILRGPRGSAGVPPLLAAQARTLKADGRRKVTGRDVLLLRMPKGGKGAEVGVWKGEFSRLLLDTLQPEQLWLVDPWPPATVAPRVYPDLAVQTQDDADAVYNGVVAAFGADPRVKLVRKASLEAAPEIPDGSLDWVYIDGLHYTDDVRADLKAWAPKLKPGGVLCGDDYYWRDHEGALSVKKAVDEWIARAKPQRWFTFRGQYLLQP